MSEFSLSSDNFSGLSSMAVLAEFEELKETFISDAEDNLATMEALVLMLETSPAEEAILNALFRTAHTLKGNASCMRFEPFLAVAHATEDVLERVRKHTIAFDGTVAAALLRTVDILRRMTPEAVAGATVLPADAIALIVTLEEISAGEGSDASAAVDRSRQTDAVAPATSRSVRVPRERLEDLAAMIDQLHVLQKHLQELVGSPSRDVEDCQLAADEVIREIRCVVAATRLVPVGPLFRQFARVARDAGRLLHKDIRLVIEEEHAEVDSTILDGLRDALGHMVRNAADHGIESADERARSGKPPAGTITLRADVDEKNVVISLVDNGRGLDWAAIRRRGVERGLLEEGQTVSEDELAALIFEPGFTTAAKITTFSGRGVGMDIVKNNVTALGGWIDIQSAPGLGTTIQLIVPRQR